MYVSPNFRTKKQLKEAIASGSNIEVYQPNGDLFGVVVPENGRVTLEGPHYPAPHTWYATGVMKDGILVSVK